MPKQDIPICRACPKCGTVAAKKLPPSRWLSASGDRLCLKCNTHYTPPTAGWVKVFTLLLGLLLVGLFIPPTFILIKSWFAGQVEYVEPADAWVDTPSAWVVILCAGISGLCGVISLSFAIAAYREKPVEPPAATQRSAMQA